MKRVIVLVALVAILTGLLLSGIADTTASITDTNIASGAEAAEVAKPDDCNSSASATITIGMRTAPNEGD